MEGEAECSRRWERKERQAEKESFFRNRVQPNIILTGWTTWWSRMEAEKRKEEKFVMEKVEWPKSRIYTNNIKKESLIRIFVPHALFHKQTECAKKSDGKVCG